MQGEHTSHDSLETWVASIEANETATMLRDTVELAKFDAFGHALDVTISTVGVDLKNRIERTVKNDTDRWILGRLQFQKECSSASGLSQCRTITRTTNEFGEVETESTDSSDGIDDTKLTVVYDKRDKYGNIEHVTATDAAWYTRESTTIWDEQGVYPTKHLNALGHVTDVEYDPGLGVLTKVTDPNGLTTVRTFDGFGRLQSETQPDGSFTTITRTRQLRFAARRIPALSHLTHQESRRHGDFEHAHGRSGDRKTEDGRRRTGDGGLRRSFRSSSPPENRTGQIVK